MSKTVDRKAPEFSELPFGPAYPSARVLCVYMHVCVCVHEGGGEGDGCVVFPVSQFTVF